jgi:ubiquitin C-terminal hydrolase
MNFDKYKDKGLSGLSNLGNTCFINTCMQILSHTYELNDFLNKETYKKKLNRKCETLLLVEWDNLRKLMWQENCVITPGKFLQVIQKVSLIKGNELFSGYQQNDLSEFLLFIIDCFHSAISREVNMTINGEVENETDKMATKCYEMIKKMYSKDYSEIWNIFYGIHVSEIISLENNSIINYTPEPYFMIDLPIPENNKNPTLYDCFNLYAEGEILSGENAWINEKGEKQNIRKKISFWSFPTILAIDLKRFKSNQLKFQTLVTFPLEDLNLSQYILGYKKENYLYDLYGVCNHSGSLLGGHYTAYVKNSNSKWYHFNDTEVKEIINIENIVSQKAYCLFYRKKSL